MQRATSPELDDLINNDTFFNVLDHGLIRVIDYMGNDQSIVDAARISYGKGTTSKSDDKGLINYLMRHYHTTPFEMCEIKLYIKMPIFVWRQLFRHRSATTTYKYTNMNEYSARYSEVTDNFYLPERSIVRMQHATNKQMSGGELSDDEITVFLDNLRTGCERQYQDYLDALKSGVSRETARMILPVNFYTEFVFKLDLHNMFHMLRLRIDSHAQYEIRVYADAIAGIIKDWCPLAYEAFEEYRLRAVTFSGKESAVLSKYITSLKSDNNCIESEREKFSNGEWREFMDKVSAKHG